jgi:hypothetical protein
MHQSGIGVGIFAAIYVLLAWGGFRWALSRVNRLARSVAQTLASAGARVLETRPAAHIWRSAEIDFDLSGKRARAEVRQWGRDSQLIAVHIEAPPMPAIWIRRERALDRMGKAIGLTHEVQLGDAAFDQAVFITTRAPERVVRDVLGSEAIRRVILEIVDRGYTVLLSRDGLRAATLTWYLRGFDPAGVTSILGRLEELRTVLPPTDPALASPFQTPRSPTTTVLPLMLVCIALGVALGVGARGVVNPPIDNGNIAVALLAGLVPWVIAVYVAARLLRDRPLVILELIVVAIGMLAVVPFAAGYALFAINSQLDGAPATLQRTRVLDHYKRNSHTVWVESWTGDTARQKLVVPSSIPVVSVGDTLEFEAHPGVLGWAWVSGIRRAD